jgi:Gram-negative bacterial TonB protein C-terminal
MPKFVQVLSSALAVCSIVHTALAQDALASTTQSRVRVVVADPGKSTADLISVPPETSWSMSIAMTGNKDPAPHESGTLAAWIQKESVINGLQPIDMHPWHIVIKYDQFDGDGDNFNSGVFEELWAGPKRYKRSYKSNDLNQTDYATESGLFRLGDQRWPKRGEMQVRSEVVDPFSFAATLHDVRSKSIERGFGVHSLDCVVFESGPGKISAPTQYCFDHGGTALRYTRGFGWFQTVYNDIVSFEGRNIAREVEVTDGGKPYLKLQIETLEELQEGEANSLEPPADATNLQGKRVSGVPMKPVQQPFPQWRSSLRSQHFSVTVEVVVGKDGHVINAHAVSGPPEAFQDAENTARKWVFQPYLVLGEPAEVETKIILTSN